MSKILKEYIVFEIVSAYDVKEAEIKAQSNNIMPVIQELNDFMDDNTDYDTIREQVLEEEGQQQEDQRNDLD